MRIIQGINSWAKHKQAQRPKGAHLAAAHERETQPISKVTHHRSEATPSRRIRCVHEDPQAHQSYQTDSRQALTHIHDMGAHLAAFRSSLRRFGRLFWSADRRSVHLGSIFHVSALHSMAKAVPGGMGPIRGMNRSWHPPIYMRGGGKNQDIHQVQLQAFSLV